MGRGQADFEEDAQILARFRRGGMAEWSMAVVLKTTEPVRVPGVRIPLPPPSFALARVVDGAVFVDSLETTLAFNGVPAE